MADRVRAGRGAGMLIGWLRECEPEVRRGWSRGGPWSRMTRDVARERTTALNRQSQRQSLERHWPSAWVDLDAARS